MSDEEQLRYSYGTGRRKTAVARVRLYPGQGTAVVNDREPLRHFGRRELEEAALRPLRVTGLSDRFHVTVKVEGAGSPVRLGQLLTDWPALSVQWMPISDPSSRQLAC